MLEVFRDALAVLLIPTFWGLIFLYAIISAIVVLGTGAILSSDRLRLFGSFGAMAIYVASPMIVMPAYFVLMTSVLIARTGDVRLDIIGYIGVYGLAKAGIGALVAGAIVGFIPFVSLFPGILNMVQSCAAVAIIIMHASTVIGSELFPGMLEIAVMSIVSSIVSFIFGMASIGVIGIFLPEFIAGSVGVAIYITVPAAIYCSWLRINVFHLVQP